MSGAPTLADIEGVLAGGEVERARTLAVEAIAHGLSHPLALRLAAEQLHREGRDEEAIVALRRALGVTPKDLDLLLPLAARLMDLDRRREALPIYKTVLDVDPNRAEAHYGAGECLATLGAVDEAQARFEAALTLDPDHADAGAALANLFARTGNWREGRVRAEAALARSPGHATAMAALSASDVGDGAYAAAESRLRFMLEPRCGEPPLTPILHAATESLLGDALHGLGRYPEAFDAWTRGNDENARIYSAWIPAAEQFRATIASLTDWFGAQSPEAWREAPPHDRASGARGHAFLMGFPRSGTTLLEHILGAHSDVVALEEGNLLGEAVQRFFGRPGGFQALASLDGETAERFRDGYWRRARDVGVEVQGRLFIDKMPLDTVNLPIIARLFPDAKILFARRDPRDVVLSCFRHVFAPNAATCNLFTLAGAADLYDAVMRLTEVYRAVLPLDLREARHERLTADFDGEVRALCAFLGLEWSDAFYDFAAQAEGRTISTPSAGQVRRGLYREATPAWTHYADQLAPVLPLLQLWVERFGYA